MEVMFLVTSQVGGSAVQVKASDRILNLL